jgi:hypothetical protein
MGTISRPYERCERMDSQLAQVVSLTAYGNAFLAGDRQPFPLETLRQSSSGFALTQSTTFYENGTTVADEPRRWFLHLSERRASRLWAVGSDPIGMQADYRGASELWTARWNQDAAGHGWNVVYHAQSSDQRIAKPNLKQTEDALRNALQDVFLFTVMNGLDQWQTLIAEATAIVNQDTMISPNALLPAKGFSDQARYIFDAASTAWIFGGQGSWSDLKFKDAGTRSEYEDITRRLYDAVVMAIIDAANSFEAP